MGITGLLLHLKDLTCDIHVRSFSGKVAAIDANCWLHKASIFCAEEIILGIETTRYIDMCIKYIDLMTENNVEPILVFDRMELEAKANVESFPRRNREESHTKGLTLWRQGQKEEARELFKKAGGIWPVTVGAVASTGTREPQGSEPRQATSSQVLTVIEVDTNGKFPWTVPCLPILVIDWTKEKVSCGGHVKKVIFQSSDPRLLLLSTPFEITASSTCVITIDNTQYTVIWDWDCFDFNSEQTSSANSSSGDENLVENVCQLDIDDEEEEEEEDFVVHSLPFKVMGVAYQSERQNHLKAAYVKMNDDPNFVVKAMIEPDPDNDFDANAIRVLINYGTGFKHVGFIEGELTKYVHQVLNSERLQHASVYQIKFRTHWAKLGYYMTLLSCKGEWPSQVVRASSRVQ